MTDAKKSGSLLDQWNLLSEIIADERSRKPHIQIAQIAINQQVEKHGNGRASVRFIEKATGLSKWRISKATADLVDWGYFSRRPGVGTRPSEFTPSWPSVRVQRDTNPPLLVSESGGTGCPSLEGHYRPLVSESGGTNPAYVAGLQAGLREAELSVGAATPPPVDALSGTTAGAPPGGFVELWNAFNLKLTNTKPKAKTAYDKLSPDADLHGLMIEAAARLHSHYEEHGVERRYRIQLQNWIAARGWEDDLPIVYSDAKSAAIAKVRGKAKPVAKTRNSTRTTARITSAAVVTTGSITELRVSTTDCDGAVLDYILPLEHEDCRKQEDGQRLLARLVSAAGLSEIEDSAELLGRTIILTGDEDEFSAPTTRPDDEPPLPIRPEPVRYANPTPVAKSDESPRDFATRMAKSINSGDWPAWMDDAA